MYKGRSLCQKKNAAERTREPAHLQVENEMTEPVNVLIVGAGAIGGLYGAILKRAGARVGLVVRSEYDVIKSDGVKITSPLGDLSYQPDGVYRSAEEVDAAPDYLVVTLKVVDGIDRVAAIKPAVGPNTTIVLIENGIDIEPEIAEAFPDNRLISALAFVAVSRVGPGSIDHKAYGQLTIGNFPSGAGPEVHHFAELLEQGGVPGVVSDRVVTERWRKAVWNAPFNPVSVLAGGADTRTMLQTPGGEDAIRAMMEEVCAAAKAAGHPLPDDIIEMNIASTHKMPPYYNSMALDYLNKRPMEVEAILGNLVRAAERSGVEVPRLKTAYALIKMLQANLAKQQ